MIPVNENKKININNMLNDQYFGWYFDYDEEYKSYFVSIFDPNNFNEELYFLLDFDQETLIKESFRFKYNGQEKRLKDSHPLYQKALVIAGQLKQEIA